MFTRTIIAYMLSSAYKHRDDYFHLRSALDTYIWPIYPARQLLNSIPQIAPSVCLSCGHVLQEKVVYGKLWHGCPSCTEAIRISIDRSLLAQKTADVAGILSPFLHRWEIDSLIATYLVSIEVSSKPVTLAARLAALRNS